MKRIHIVGLIALSLVFVTQPFSFAGQSKDKIINQELDCMARRMESNAPVQWDDVCYTADAQTQKIELALADSSTADFGEDIFDYSKKNVADVQDHETGDVFMDRTYKVSNSGSGISRFFNRNNPLTKLEVSLDAFYSTYREPSLMRQRGIMYGMSAVYTHRFKEREPIYHWRDAFKDECLAHMFRIDAMFAGGDFDYESEGTGKDDGVRDYMFETRGVVGYDFPVRNIITITPYIGLGYRYLLDDGGGRLTTTGHWGYDRESNYFYAPLGIDATFDLQNKWSFKITMEYDWFIRGKQKSHLGDGGQFNSNYSDMPTLESTQKTGQGYRGSLRITREGEKIDFFFEPFFRYWDIKDSTTDSVTNGILVVSGLEPENNTAEYGFKLGIQY